ncbi:hypothetical protein GCM10009682_54880 [Luedemannella flava]|uniref:DUF6891 domain-containing protein n=1 Tax=Luedemannella flava TaxID=349316 RepID=A0ABN2MM50_9ACTN
MTTPLSATLFDDVHDFVTAEVTAGYLPTDAIVDEVLARFGQHAPDHDRLRRAARTVAEQALATHREAQQAWPTPTDCERLDAAFAALDDVGVVARQHYSCCGTCGADEIRAELQQAHKAGRPARGYTFFHVQDTAHAVSGEGLYLSYGAHEPGSDAAVAIGHEVVAALRDHGLSPAWNGKVAHRILLPLEWRRRRDDSRSYQE